MNLKKHTGYVKFGGENVCFWFWFKSGFIKIRKKKIYVCCPNFFHLFQQRNGIRIFLSFNGL